MITHAQPGGRRGTAFHHVNVFKVWEGHTKTKWWVLLTTKQFKICSMASFWRRILLVEQGDKDCAVTMYDSISRGQRGGMSHWVDPRGG